MLSFDADKYDFWKIYDRIKQFYPIGIPRNESNIYYSYHGLKEMERIIVENIHDHVNFTDHWENFCKEIESELGKPVTGTTYGQAPSFSSFVQLQTSTVDNLLRSQEVHFYVSLLGPFYTIIAQDNCTVEVEKGKYFRNTNYLTVSPEDDYKDTFVKISHKIEKHFEGHRFIPFQICQQRIEGLYVRYTDENANAVFNALFNNSINLTARTVGNGFYKSEDWIREDYIENVGTITLYPPN